MKYYTYFPGCCLTPGGYAKVYDWSAQAVSHILNTELSELDAWNCCGSVPCSSIDKLSSLCLSARNLALAEKIGLDMVAPCTSCYVILNQTNSHLKEYPQVKAKVDEALAAGGLEYHGTVRIRHLLDIFVNDIGYDEINSKVIRDLGGLKIAPYYGCQSVRPTPSFDHPEYPQSLDKLISVLGGEAIPFPLKSRCCGGSLIISEEGLALDLIGKLLDCAVSNGAECIITGCPLCQMNLDTYQSRVNKKFKTNFNLPILFFTQLMGVAFGLGDKELGLKTNIVSAKEILVKP